MATILLVGVDLMVRSRLEAPLSGHRLVTSDSADPPDLVICDIARVDADDVAGSWPDTPILGFTNHTDTHGLQTTLGRNGSDYTATLLASLLQAESVTVWTDVLGVMTADPNLVREAAPVDRLSYDEALELAYFGTRMFHPRTIIPLRDCGAALVIRSTTHPDSPGTRIDATGNDDPSRPTCVTSLENLSLIGVQSRRTGPGRRTTPSSSAASSRAHPSAETRAPCSRARGSPS